MNKRVFSLPINPKLSEEFVVNTFLPFLKEYREYILDLYFTCRIPPFDQDAMGDTFLSPEALTESACYISNQSDIFSFGALFYMLLEGFFPWHDIFNISYINSI